MKNYLPIAVGLILLAGSPALANDGMGVDVNAKAQTDLSAGAAAAQFGASTQSAVDAKTADAKTADATTADAKTDDAAQADTTQQENTTIQQTTQQTSETDSKAAPVLENQPATAGTVPGTEATQTETNATETSSTDAKGTAAAPNVQKLFKFFHSQKQQAEGDTTEKKDASTPAPDAQSPQ
jgi:hypothetical protein